MPVACQGARLVKWLQPPLIRPASELHCIAAEDCKSRQGLRVAPRNTSRIPLCASAPELVALRTPSTAGVARRSTYSSAHTDIHVLQDHGPSPPASGPQCPTNCIAPERVQAARARGERRLICCLTWVRWSILDGPSTPDFDLYAYLVSRPAADSPRRRS